MTMRYLPHTPDDVKEMLRVAGADSLEDLFSGIPADCRMTGELDLPRLTEWELDRHMDELAGRNAASGPVKVFVGAGSYHHVIPASVRYLLGRSEFSTSYTPYQPEISQGTLQAIYEYQTLTARLLGLDVANASMYDGASALAEALLMAIRVSKAKRRRVAVSRAIHPLYRRVVATYFGPTDYEIVELPLNPDGTTDLSDLAALAGADQLAAVALQSPNYLGVVERLDAAAASAHDLGALLVAGFTEPLAFGLFKSPGVQGADIACGEGQSMGVPQSFGGPGLGMFACRESFMRAMPGRLVGRTLDLDGRPGFVLTLSTREQHIRREKATSNICSNQGLCATTAGMYMASLGGTGIREMARLNRDKAEYLKAAFRAAGFEIPFAGTTFNEFVVKLPPGFSKVRRHLADKGIVAGLPLAPDYPERQHHWLFCATETVSREDMDRLIKEVSS